jgi:hypothetical protein
MRIPVLVLFLWAAATIAGQARIGEDNAQLAERYGSPLSHSMQKRGPGQIGLVLEAFQHNGIQVDVSLLGGVSVEETFHKLNGDPFLPEEINALLADNSQGRDWEAPVHQGGQTKWTRDDGSVATLAGNHVLRVTSIGLINAETQAGEFEVAPSVQGF